MQNLFDINEKWFSGILSDFSDQELETAYNLLQQFYNICDLTDIFIYYELFDMLEKLFIAEILKRFFKKVPAPIQ